MLKEKDSELYGYIEQEAQRQETEIELIASENYTSKEVMEANGSVLTNKYSEWYPGKRYYAGQEYIDKIENLAIERAKKLFGAEHVNVQPYSGSPANSEVFFALLNQQNEEDKEQWIVRKDTIMGMNLDHGGHLTHGHPLTFSWKYFHVVPYTVDKETELIDMDEVERLALEHKPKMIIAWFSAYPRNLDWKRFREIADKIGAFLMADIAHIAGLIAGWALENPVPYCDVVTTTTHKTLRGPRWGMIMCKQELAKKIDMAVFPWNQWGPHEHIIAGKAVAFGEALQPEFQDYARQVIKNAQTVAQELENYGFKIITWWTDNHLVLIDVFWSKWVTGKEAEKALEKVGLSTNKNMIPYDTRRPLDPSWIRIGTSAATTRGMNENEMKTIARVFYEAIENKDDEQKLLWLKHEIQELCGEFPIYKGKE